MAGATTNRLRGATVVFGTSSFAFHIKGISQDGVECDDIETSYIGTAAVGANSIGNKTFIPSDLVDGGEITLTGDFDPDQLPPVGGVVETITLTFVLITGDGSAANYAFSGYVKSAAFDGTIGEEISGTIVVKVAGTITRTAAA